MDRAATWGASLNSAPGGTGGMLRDAAKLPSHAVAPNHPANEAEGRPNSARAEKTGPVKTDRRGVGRKKSIAQAIPACPSK